MPWTVRDVDSHKSGLTDRQKRQWVSIANSALERCLADGNSRGSCERSAIRQANGSVGNNKENRNYIETNRLPQSNRYTVNTTTHRGRKHLIVPVVMMVEGVHNGSHGPLLHLGEELGRWPGAWNGIPVVVHHPEYNGVGVSANSPDIVETEVIGRVFHTEYVDGRVRSEAWIDEAKTEEVSPDVLAYLGQGRPLDVSVGVFTDDEPTSGAWHDEEYVGIARNHRPDHLALLPGAQGACSWEDGCGVRANMKGGEKRLKRARTRKATTYAVTKSARTPMYKDVTDGDWEAPDFKECVAGYFKHHPDAEQTEVTSVSEAPQTMRNWIASLSLLGSPEGESFAELLYYPVVDPDTLELNENALRGVVGGTGKYAEIPGSVARSARMKAYSLLNQEFDAGLTGPENLEAAKELARNGHYFVQMNQQGYQQLASQIQQKLDAMDTDTKLHFLEELFDEYFVYRVSQHGGSQGTSLYRREYSVSDDGVVEFGGEPISVVRKVEYADATNTNKGGDNTMPTTHDNKNGSSCCPEKVELLIQSENTQFSEDDRNWLSSLNEGQIGKLEAADQAIETNSTKGGEGTQMTRDEAVQVLKDELSDPDKFKKLVPGEVRQQMEHGMRLHQEHREKLITGITNNTEVYSKEELEARDTQDLEKLSKAITPKSDYSAFGGGGPDLGDYGAENAGDDEVLPPPGVSAE